MKERCFFAGRDLNEHDIEKFGEYLSKHNINLKRHKLWRNGENVAYYVDHDTRLERYNGSLWFCVEKGNSVPRIEDIEGVIRDIRRNEERNPTFVKKFMYTNSEQGYSRILARNIQIF